MDFKKILIAVLFISTAFLAYLHFFASDERNLSGKWTASVDLTSQAAVTALDWLQDIEAVSVSLQDIESQMQGLSIEVQLTFEQSERYAGEFRSNIVPESYDSCSQAAYEAFASAFRKLMAERLRMADYEGSTDEDAVEELVVKTFGMSTVSYLKYCVPELLPSLEELQARYDVSGTYQTANDVLTRQFNSGDSVITKTEKYIRKDDNLVLTGEKDSDSQEQSADDYPVVYRLY